MGAMRVGQTLSSVLDSFYANKDAVTLANEFVTEGGYAWGLPADQLDVVINADSSEALVNQASNAANQQVQGSSFEEEDEQDSKFNDWLSTFVSGLMNRSDERKGERDDDMMSKDNWDNDMKDGKKDWNNDMKDDKKDWNNDMNSGMSADSKDWNDDMKNDMSTDSKDWNNDMKNDMSADSKDWNDSTKDSMGETGKKGNF